MTRIGYVLLLDKPSHKYGAFTPECHYTTDQGPLPLIVGLDNEKCKNSLQCHIQDQDWRRGSAQFIQPHV